MDEKSVLEYRVALLEDNAKADKEAMKKELTDLQQEVREVAKFQTKQIGALVIISVIVEMFIAHLWK